MVPGFPDWHFSGMNLDWLVEFLAILQMNCVLTQSLDIPTQAKFPRIECKLMFSLCSWILTKFYLTKYMFTESFLKCWQKESVFIEKQWLWFLWPQLIGWGSYSNKTPSEPKTELFLAEPTRIFMELNFPQAAFKQQLILVILNIRNDKRYVR